MSDEQYHRLEAALFNDNYDEVLHLILTELKLNEEITDDT